MNHELITKGIAAGVDNGEGGLGFIVAMSESMFGPDDPDTQFYKWLSDNRGRINEAAAERGIAIKEGPGFGRRLRDEYIKTLEQ